MLHDTALTTARMVICEIPYFSDLVLVYSTHAFCLFYLFFLTFLFLTVQGEVRFRGVATVLKGDCTDWIMEVITKR